MNNLYEFNDKCRKKFLYLYLFFDIFASTEPDKKHAFRLSAITAELDKDVFRRYRRTATMTKSRVWGGSGHGPTRRNSAAVGVPFLVVLVVATLWSGGARAVSDNLLKIACDDMTPRHPGFKSENVQHVANPYRLVVDGPVVPGNLVNVTLSSANGSTPFKGFMVQARDADGHMLGTFLPDCQDGGNKSHHMITCSNGVEPYVSLYVLLGVARTC